MVYFFCPHCRAALYIPLEWGRMECPFCGGAIVFSDTVVLEWRGGGQENAAAGRNFKKKKSKHWTCPERGKGR